MTTLTTQERKAIADTIIAQLGGNQFRAMTGAKDFTFGERGELTFGLPARFAKDGINKVRVTLTADDDYTVEFFRINMRAKEMVKTIATEEGVYCDTLRSTFTRVTGLDCTLGGGVFEARGNRMPMGGQ